MTPAEELRQAASLMRERATAATAGPWRAGPSSKNYRTVSSCSGALYDVALLRATDALHIAGMHPGVALKVADLLDKIAWMAEMDPDLIERVGGDETLAVARAYLGTGGQG